MAIASWLFVKGSESIWIERPHGRTMIVAGPGVIRSEQDFPDEEALQAFQIDLAERLTGGGWLLWGFDRERRTQMERRGAPRQTNDRRRITAA